MKTLAGIDSSGSSPAVLETARSLAPLLATDVEVLHVNEGGVPSRTATAAILEALDDDDVFMAVIGVDAGRRDGARVDHVASDVMIQASKPLVLVPPKAKVFGSSGPVKVLVPLDDAPATAKALRGLLDRLADRGVEIVAVHVFDSTNGPQYWDHFYYDFPAWYERFRREKCRPLSCRLELGRGSVVPEILRLADAEKARLIAVAWSQVLGPGHARLLTELLSSTQIPVLLVPVVLTATSPAPPLLNDVLRGEALDCRAPGLAGDELLVELAGGGQVKPSHPTDPLVGRRWLKSQRKRYSKASG